MAARALLLLGAFLVTVSIASPTPEQPEEPLAQVEQQDAGETLEISQSRERRQAGGRRPGIFRLLFQLIAETRNDTRSAFNQIGEVVGNSFMDDSQTTTSTAATIDNEVTSSTTQGPPRLSRQQFMTILRRNLRGLTRLFNREVEMALEESNKNAAKARKDFTEALRPFLTT